MASIRHDGRGWRARYYDPTGRRREKRFAKKVDAARWVDEITASTVRGEWVDPTLGRVTVGDWSARWFPARRT